MLEESRKEKRQHWSIGYHAYFYCSMVKTNEILTHVMDLVADTERSVRFHPPHRFSNFLALALDPIQSRSAYRL